MGIGDERVDPFLLSEAFEGGESAKEDEDDAATDGDDVSPPKYRPRPKIGVDPALAEALAKTKSEKLQALYHSCVALALSPSTHLQNRHSVLGPNKAHRE